ncbi:MAG TPA: hypothetical protein VMU08_08220 [Rhizomicrobium sp.]|nr:hypothetical protein [Rhizomicrobium sp.]
MIPFAKLKAAALAAALWLATVPAFAAGQIMCQPSATSGVEGPRTVGGTNSQVPSGTIYSFNGQGCAYIKQQDMGYFTSQGYTAGASLGSIVYSVPTTATGTTSYQIGTLPPSTYIQQIIVQNTDGSNAVTGGIKMGSTSGGTDIIGTALAVGTSSLVFETDALTLKRVFSSTASQALFAEAVTSWNTPTTVTITVVYGYF